MGIYYMFVNDVTEERVEPNQIGAGSIKFGGIVGGAAAHIFTYLVMTAEEGTWHILSDGNVRRPPAPSTMNAPESYLCRLAYTDITKQIIEQYNEDRGNYGPTLEGRGDYGPILEHTEDDRGGHGPIRWRGE